MPAFDVDQNYLNWPRSRELALVGIGTFQRLYLTTIREQARPGEVDNIIMHNDRVGGKISPPSLQEASRSRRLSGKEPITAQDAY